MPAHNDALRIPSNGIGQIDDHFTRYNQSKRKKALGEQGWPVYLANTFTNHAGEAKERAGLVPQWNTILCVAIISSFKQDKQSQSDRKISFRQDLQKIGQLSDYSHAFDVGRAAEYAGGRHSHRTVLFVTDLITQEFRPSVGEFMVLVSWMLGGMCYPEVAVRAKRNKKNKTSRSHILFPVHLLSTGSIRL